MRRDRRLPERMHFDQHDSQKAMAAQNGNAMVRLPHGMQAAVSADGMARTPRPSPNARRAGRPLRLARLASLESAVRCGKVRAEVRGTHGVMTHGVYLDPPRRRHERGWMMRQDAAPAAHKGLPRTSPVSLQFREATATRGRLGPMQAGRRPLDASRKGRESVRGWQTVLVT